MTEREAAERIGKGELKGAAVPFRLTVRIPSQGLTVCSVSNVRMLSVTPPMNPLLLPARAALTREDVGEGELLQAEINCRHRIHSSAS